MRLLYVFAAILAFSLAEEDKAEIEDLEAAASSIELMKEVPDQKAEASAYSYPYVPNQPTWTKPYVPPTNTWNPPPSEPVKPWVPPVQNDYVYPSPTYPPVHPTYPPVHPTYPPVHPTWSTPHYHHSTTTTPVPVIKNEQWYGDNGSYKYEYKIGDGTHVGEEGYFTDPKGSEESLVKKGWYSYVGADGKTYTVTYWADKTGFHAYGDHLPTPPPVPAAIQAALDKEKEAEKYKPQYDYPQTPAPTVYPTKPVYYPPKEPTYPPQQPSYNPPQPTYPPQQPSYNPPQQTYYPPQQTYYPQPQQPTYG